MTTTTAERFLAYFEDEKPKPRGETRPLTEDDEPYVTAAVEDELAILSAAGSGTRNDTLNTAAVKLGRLPVDREKLRDRLIDACHVNGLVNDDGIRSVENTIASGFRKADVDGPREIPKRAVKENLPEAISAGPALGGEDLLAKVLNGTALDAKVFEPLVQHIPGLVTEGLGIIGGSPKVGKSWFVADLALAVAQGGLALGSVDVRARSVFLLALEDGDKRLQKRMRHLNHGKPIPGNLDTLTEVQPGRVVDTIEAWLARHAHDAEPPMIILDTLGKARPQRNRGDDPFIADYQFAGRLKAAIDSVPGAALLVVHHTRKGADEDFLNTLSGTQGIAAAADFVLILTRKRKSEEGMLSVTGRDIREDEYALTVRDGIWQIDGSDLSTAAAAADERRDKDRLGDRSIAVLEIVNSQIETKPADVAQKLGIDAKQAAVYLGRLVESGQVAKRTRGVYVPVGTVESVVST